MNLLLVGTEDKTDSILEHLPDTFLLLDDGPMIDAFLSAHPFPKHWDEISASPKITLFDFKRHSFNPLKDITYKKARDFVAVLDAVFPEGANTLTKKSGNFAILQALLSGPKRLERLLPVPDKHSEPGHIDAYQKIQTLLLSPVLEHVLCRPTNFSFDGILLARLDRSVLGDFDAFVLANLLISNYQGQIAIPDFGFYGRLHHTNVIRQERLIAGVHFLDEVPELRNELLLIENKEAQHCTADDAEVLAGYAGLLPNTNVFTDFVQRSIE